jgi:hypothetical protein
MNLDREREWAAEIDRELKALPELAAPPSLVARVMSAIEHPVLVPWYRRAWQTWPAPLQAAAMLALLGMLGAVCFWGWELVRSPGLAAMGQDATRWFAGLNVLWAAVNALAGVLLLAVKQLNTAVLAGLLAIMALAWMACVGLGTVYIRLAFARR